MKAARAKAWMLAGCAAVLVMFSSCGDTLFACLENAIYADAGFLPESDRT